MADSIQQLVHLLILTDLTLWWLVQQPARLSKKHRVMTLWLFFAKQSLSANWNISYPVLTSLEYNGYGHNISAKVDYQRDKHMMFYYKMCILIWQDVGVSLAGRRWGFEYIAWLLLLKTGLFYSRLAAYFPPTWQESPPTQKHTKHLIWVKYSHS